MLTLGIDPGSTGAVAGVETNAAGGLVDLWADPLPVVHGELDYHAFLRLLDRRLDCFHSLSTSRHPHLWLEDPNGHWPGAVRTTDVYSFGRNFGDIRGSLRGLGWRSGDTLHEVAPGEWKGRLGLRGKGADPHSTEALALFTSHYPRHRHVVLGPLGGLQDGKLDALLVAHYGQVLLTHSPSPVSAGKWCRRPPKGLWCEEPIDAEWVGRGERVRGSSDPERTDTTLA